MKSEERHHLHENELGKIAVRTQNVLEKYGILIVAAFGLALVLLVAVGWWMASSRAALAAHWSELAAAGTTEEYGAVADKLKGTPPGFWARLREAELVLDEALPKMFSDRQAGLADLKRSESAFQQVVDAGSAAPAEVRERALFGLARVLETQSDSDTGPAIKAYQRLANEFPDSIYKPYSEQRVAALESGGAKDFYGWFAKQNPKPPEFRRPQDRLPGAAGATGADDPFALPPSPGGFFPGGTPPATTTPAAPTTTPAAPNAEPTPEKPAEPTAEKPAESATSEAKPAEPAQPETPAPESKPDAEKPAEPQ